MKVVISGGSGLVGMRLSRLLASQGHTVYHIGRKRRGGEFPSYEWNLSKKQLDHESIEGKDAVIHLAGAGVAESRWTSRRKKEILESRTHSTELLVKAISAAKNPPKIFISASAIGYYGTDTGSRLMTEQDPPASDFLAEVCRLWEDASQALVGTDVRRVVLRIGVVLSKEGGALPKLLQPPVAAPIGSGAQYMSTIHIDDLCQMFAFAIEKPINGVFNAVGPEPLSNADFSKEAAKAAGKIYLPIPVPGFLLKVALGEMANVVLGGSKVSCQKIVDAGFGFRFDTVASALTDLLATK